MPSSPTPRLLIGLVATLITVAAFCLYSLRQLDGLRQLQTNTIGRSRENSRHLIRIQNNLNAIGLALPRLFEGTGEEGANALRREAGSMRTELEAALRSGALGQQDAEAIGKALHGFSADVQGAVELTESGSAALARKLVSEALENQLHALSASVGGLLMEAQESQELAARQIAAIYDRAEREIYIFSIALILAIAAGGLLTARDARRLFDRINALSERRQILAQRMIGLQEEVLRSISRELHDEFGQILTAIGAILRRAERKHLSPSDPLIADLNEVKAILQQTLEDTRGLSQALHPAILEDYGLERAVERYLPVFESQTGIAVRFEKDGCAIVPDDKAIHVYRVFQEALTNVAKHSKASEATVRLKCEPAKVELEVEDNGIGMNGSTPHGLGLVVMHERAELVEGRVHVARPPGGGTLVRLEVPLEDND